MDNVIQKLNNLVQRLIELGEGREELNFWQQLFPHLTSQEQGELIQNLEKELAVLQRA